MFYEIVATLVAGVAGAGVVMLLNKLTGGRLPRWAVPFGVAAGMLVTTIANEYAWYGRTVANLPEGLVVVSEVENSSLYRPWVRVKPFVEQFVAVDGDSLLLNKAYPDLRMVTLVRLGRWVTPSQQAVMVDCAQGRRAPLAGPDAVGSEGWLDRLAWFDAPADDPVVTATCALEGTP